VLASGPDDIFNLFADFIQRTYADDVCVLYDPEPILLLDDPPFGALQFTADEVHSVLLELDVSKGTGHDGILPLILKNCASAFACPLSLFLTNLYRHVFFPTLSYVTLIFKEGRRNNVTYIICNSEAI
jgi:hypothetical protein